jgi:dethiobiotin synthetase
MRGGVFVTGTDTEVGKTHISAGLLHLLGQGGARSAGYKPVAAGLVEQDGEVFNEDVRLLQRASSLPLTEAEVGPMQLRAPCAPHLAAALDGVAIDRTALRHQAQALAARCDWLVVEGVGGWRVPLSPLDAPPGEAWDSADLAADLCGAFHLPVLLVVGMRLGCLSHALLTVDAVRARGLRLAGWVANHIDPAMLRAEDNLATLRQWLTARAGLPCLGVVPWLAAPTPAAVAAHLDAAQTRAALATPAMV